MALDGIFLNLLIQETAAEINGCRVDKIYQPTKDEFVFLLRKKDFSGKLVVSANTVTARCHLTEMSYENPSSPPMLCMLMRKKLVGAKVVNLSQPGLERVCFIDFDTTDEFGDDCTLTLVLEIMGRCSNVILCSQDKRVIDSVRRTDASNTSRVLMPGARYELPPAQDKYDISLNDLSRIKEVLIKHGPKEVNKALQEALQGMCPAVCREIEFLCGAAGLTVNELTDEHFSRITQCTEKILHMIKTGTASPTVICDSTGKTVDFSYMPLTHYGKDFTSREFPSLAALLDEYYSKRDKDSSLNAKKQELLKLITNTYSRISRRTDAQTRELAATEDCDSKRIYGELIKANLHLIEKGADVCRVPNYYDEECREVTIKLKPELSPAANAARYFKEYRKACTAKQMLSGFIQAGKSELLYLDTVFDELSRAENSADISEIKDELTQAGYIKDKTNKKNQHKTQKTGLPLKYVSSDGFLIMSGKNNRQNDILTLKTAEKNDIWFHIKNSAGSHVIVFTEGKTPPDTTLTEAAIIAATQSSVSDSGAMVAVDYCEVKKVKKPSGAAPGMVIYDGYKTAYVTPDKELVKKLAAD